MKMLNWRWPMLMIAAAMTADCAAEGTEVWTLDRAIGHALTNSPDAGIARHRIAAARAGLDQANSALWPQLQLQSSYTRTDNPMLAFGGILNQRSFTSSLDFNDVPGVDNLNIRGVLTIPLYTGGRVQAGRDTARANIEAARANADAIRNTLAFEVARAFHTVLKTREYIRAAESAVEAFEQHLGIARHRVDTGAALQIEVLDVQVKLAQAREDLARARNAGALSTLALRNALGIETGDISVAGPAPVAEVPAGNDFSQRPELVAIRQAERAAEAQVRQAQSGHRPRVSAFGSLDDDRGWVNDGDGRSYSAGVIFQWDLWDGRLTRGRVQEAQANLEAVSEEHRKLRLAIHLEVEQSRRHLDEANERLIVAQNSIAQAVESVELTRIRFEQGLVLSTQLIDAQTALTTARMRRAEAEADRRIAIGALRKALGLPQLDPSP